MSTDGALSPDSISSLLEQKGVTADAVIDRMRDAAGCKSDLQLAKYLNTSRSNVSKWRSRKVVPYAEAMYVSIMEDRSISSILFGDGDSKADDVYYIDPRITSAILLNIHNLGIFKFTRYDENVDDISLMAHSIAVQYNRSISMIDELVKAGHCDFAKAHEIVVSGADFMAISAGKIFEPRSRRKKADNEGPQ